MERNVVEGMISFRLSKCVLSSAVIAIQDLACCI